ncbi:MAG: hypothetical protein O7E52_03440 [Candidatus Poribacteria bacterium]|nr:hypothetical protein [Candidatus Poribacteria bacterium]
MKRKYEALSIVCLLCMVLASPDTHGKDAVTATFTFGKIEVLKTGEQEWRFLEKETGLATSDLVRMPPFALIRLKTVEGGFLPTLSGGREVPVVKLINEGLQRKNNTKGKHIRQNFDGSPAIDGLPLGNQAKMANRVSVSDRIDAIKVSPRELEDLRRQLDSPPDEITSFIPHLPLSPTRENADSPTYPGPNLDLARKLYRALNAVEAEMLKRPRPLLYAQLLRHAGIDAELAANDKGELFVMFDSGISTDSTKRITANQGLIRKRQGKETIWIPVWTQSPGGNFTTAWYDGARIGH